MQKWAQNSLLKTLEESNKYVIIILLAVNKGAFYPTILSRCQVYAFSDVGLKNELIDSVYRVFLAAYEEDYERVFESIAAFHDNDFSDILSCISSFVRDFLACRLSGESTSIYNQAYSGFIQRAAKRYSVEMLHDTISFICDIRTGASANVKLMLQAIFLRF
jgi:DNA polymerase III gamma/tau subunit